MFLHNEWIIDWKCPSSMKHFGIFVVTMVAKAQVKYLYLLTNRDIDFSV